MMQDVCYSRPEMWLGLILKKPATDSAIARQFASAAPSPLWNLAAFSAYSNRAKVLKRDPPDAYHILRAETAAITAAVLVQIVSVI
jgi:hypothetical protein